MLELHLINYLLSLKITIKVMVKFNNNKETLILAWDTPKHIQWFNNVHK